MNKRKKKISKKKKFHQKSSASNMEKNKSVFKVHDGAKHFHINKILIAIITSCAGAVLGAIVTIIITQGFPPLYTRIRGELSSLYNCSINGKEEIYSAFSGGNPCFNISFFNDNEGVIRIDNVSINIHKYEPISEFTYQELEGNKGGLQDVLYMSATVNPEKYHSIATFQKKMYKDNTEEPITEQFIVLPEKSVEEFRIGLNMEAEGLYEISASFEYIYHGKSYTISTEKQTIVYINNDPVEYKWDNAEKNPIDITRNEDFDWWTGYIEILENLEDYFDLSEHAYAQLKDMDFNGIPELHVYVKMGTHRLLEKTRIFYYDNDVIKSIDGDYGMIESQPPQLFINSITGEKCWLIGYEPFLFDIVNIIQYGIHVKKVTISEDKFQLEPLIEVEGVKYTNKAPTVFYAYGLEYHDVNEFMQAINSPWPWECVEETRNEKVDELFFGDIPELKPDKNEIKLFINNYIPLSY